VDTFAAAAGRAGSGDVARLPLPREPLRDHAAGVTVVVCDTGADQGATAPAEAVFLERRAECGRAVALLRRNSVGGVAS